MDLPCSGDTNDHDHGGTMKSVLELKTVHEFVEKLELEARKWILSDYTQRKARNTKVMRKYA